MLRHPQLSATPCLLARLQHAQPLRQLVVLVADEQQQHIA